uniref:LRRCT domain-containing protein n=1 Tax=Amphiprion percula TaxID=161767 RepID=A0A3P8S2I7_AMPPE
MQHLVWLILAMQWMVEGVENCPDICKCSRKAGPEKSEVNCHKRGLHAFPSNLPPDAWILKLGNSVIICLFLVSELRKLYLHDNPWQCDCNIMSLVRWMGQTKAMLSPREALKCVSPPELRKKSLGSLEAGTLLCRTRTLGDSDDELIVTTYIQSSRQMARFASVLSI